VATYDVDINLALQGSEKLKALSTALRQVTKDVGKLNAKTIKIGKELDKTFKKSHIQNADNYSKAVRRAERALRKAAAGTREEREAISMVVRARKEANAELERQNALLKEEERIQGVIKVKASDRVSVTSPLSSPVFGARHIEGSPMAREFGFEPKKKRGGATAPTGITAGKRFGAAVSAGAFPLLFGGGPLMSLGGAAGGAISGSTFGPAAIALQVLGGALDGFVAQVALTGQALNKFTFDFTEVTRAAGLAGTATATYIAEIEKLADSTEAQEIATRALAIKVGQDGVDSLKRFGDASAEASRQFAQSMTMLGAAVSEVAGPVAQFVANALAAGNLLRAGRANATQDPELQRLAEQEQSLLRGNFDGSMQERMMEIAKVQEQIRDRQQEINIVLQETTRIRAEDLQRLDNELSIQTDNLHVLALRRELLQNGKELSEEELAVAKENIEKGRIQVKRERLLVEQAQLIERAKKGELSFRKVALIIAGKQLEIDEALQKLETKGSDKTGPKSRALQLQAAILREKLKQFGIEMDVQKLNETTIQSLQRQNKGIEERRDKEIQILEFQRQQEIANNKVAGDAKFINKLYDERKQTVRDTLGLELNQNNARIKAIELQQKLTRMRADQQTAGIGRGLRRQIEDAQRGMANPFDSNELQMLQLRVDQVRRSDDAYRSLNERIAENNRIIDESGDKNQIEKAEKENKVLRERIGIYQDLLPQLEAVEQAQLRQQQIIDQLTPATEAFAGALIDTVTGAQTAQEAFANFLRSVANMLADTAKKMIAQYIAIGIARMFAGVPAKSAPAPDIQSGAGFGLGNQIMVGGMRTAASGKGALMNQPYLVGERGPELFVPKNNGTIVPNHQMGAGATVTVNVDASGSSVQGDSDQATQLGNMLAAAVQSELVKQKRPGGLLAS
jgi:hypothetical protein